MELKDKILKVLEELYYKNRVPEKQELEIDDIEEYGRLFEIMEHDGLIFGTKITRAGQKNKVHFVWKDSTNITIRGIEYLKQNEKSKGAE